MADLSESELLEAARAQAQAGGLSLRQDDQGLSLEGDGMTLRLDFRDMLPRLAPGRLQRELLVRAAKVRRSSEQPTAIDATAGLGQDALLLAAAGFSVRMYERNPVMAALLGDALRRAADDPDLANIVGRMELSCADGIEALREIGARRRADEGGESIAEGDAVEGSTGGQSGGSADEGGTAEEGTTEEGADEGGTAEEGATEEGAAEGGTTKGSAVKRPDVVYLDPMFPARRKSAQVKKKFQLLHHLERPCEDAEELLHAALAANPRKIVVKRPLKGPHLAGIKPSYELAGKAVRYDVIALP